MNDGPPCILAAHQPHFWPWLGYLDKWRRADLFVVLDDVAYSKGDYVNRNRFSIGGQERWLTLPVENATSSAAIRDLRISRAGCWRRKHWRTLEQAFPRVRGRPLRDELDRLYQSSSSSLVEWCTASMCLLWRWFFPDRPAALVYASQLGLAAELQGSQRLVALCQRLGATAYLSGMGAAAYLQPAAFADAQIELRWNRRQPPGRLSALHYLLAEDRAAVDWLRGETT